MKIHCPKCETACHEIAQLCHKCGHRLAAPTPYFPDAPREGTPPPADAAHVNCPKCETRCLIPAAMCYACGHRLPESKPSPGPTDQPILDAVRATEGLQQPPVPADQESPEQPASPHRRICLVCHGVVSVLAKHCPGCGHPAGGFEALRAYPVSETLGLMARGVIVLVAVLVGVSSMLQADRGNPLGGIHTLLIALFVLWLALRK